MTDATRSFVKCSIAIVAPRRQKLRSKLCYDKGSGYQMHVPRLFYNLSLFQLMQRKSSERIVPPGRHQSVSILMMLVEKKKKRRRGILHSLMVVVL